MVYSAWVIKLKGQTVFSTQNFKIVEADKSDLVEIAEIYNSNKTFLQNHIGLEKVDDRWCLADSLDMSEGGFLRCKILDAKTETTVGFIDFKIS